MPTLVVGFLYFSPFFFRGYIHGYIQNHSRYHPRYHLKRFSPFSYCEYLTTVYYAGTEREWKNLTINIYDDNIINVTCYYSETAPTSEGNFWHYVDGVPTVG